MRSSFLGTTENSLVWNVNKFHLQSAFVLFTKRAATSLVIFQIIAHIMDVCFFLSKNFCSVRKIITLINLRAHRVPQKSEILIFISPHCTPLYVTVVSFSTIISNLSFFGSFMCLFLMMIMGKEKETLKRFSLKSDPLFLFEETFPQQFLSQSLFLLKNDPLFYYTKKNHQRF